MFDILQFITHFMDDCFDCAHVNEGPENLATIEPQTVHNEGQASQRQPNQWSLVSMRKLSMEMEKQNHYESLRDLIESLFLLGLEPSCMA